MSGRRLRDFVESNVPEITLVAVGVLLRVSMIWSFNVWWGYDAGDHWKIEQWFENGHRTLPDVMYGRCAYHPPLYYVVAALIRGLGVSPHGLTWISIVCGSLRLALIWLLCLRALPGQRLARLGTLAMAAVIPASVHLDGMVSNEGLSNFLAMAAMFCVPALFASPGRWRASLAIGALLGLEILTKLSALALVGAFVTGLAIEIVRDGRSKLRENLRRVAPAFAGGALLLLLTGWYCVHNQRLYGKPFLASFDGPDKVNAVQYLAKPYFARRSLSWPFGWDNEMYKSPYYPSGHWPVPHLLPALIASSFVDAYNYSFTPPPQRGAPSVTACYKPLRPEAMTLARASVVGGTLIAFATIAAWFVAVAWCWRNRRFDLLTLALVPLFGLLGQIHFATKYPVDSEGVVKGLYMQFSAPPLYALYGLTMEWAWRRSRWRWLTILLGLALVPVAAYTIYSRLLVRP